MNIQSFFRLSQISVPMKFEASSGTYGSNFFRTHILRIFLILFFIVFAFRIARIGFNPTDDGLILAQSKRLLLGQIPHLDFLSPRPVGSPIIHTLEIFLPFPQIFTSRLFAITEVLITSILICEIVWKSAANSIPRLIKPLSVIVIFGLNLHNFPLMSWHTIDGVMLCVLATWLLTRDNRKYKAFVLVSAGLIIGYTPLIKQSFAPMLLVGALMIFFKEESMKIRISALTAIPIPGIFYGLWLIRAGAFESAFQQMTGGTIPAISTVWRDRSFISNTLLFFTVLFLFASFTLNNRCSLAENRIWRGSRFALSFSLTAYASHIVIDGNLALTNWASPLLIVACAAIILTIASEKQLPIGQIVIVSIATMITLSWGYPNPNLLSGGLLVIIIYPFVTCIITFTMQIQLTDFFKHVAGIVTTMVVLCSSTAMWAWNESRRESSVYRDLPFNLQTESLSKFSPKLEGVRSNKQLAQSLGDVKSCIQKHKTKNLAVLPDGAILPFIFDKQNPLRIDWWTPSELIVEPRPLFLDNQLPKDYLILFQSFSMPSVAGTQSLPTAISPDSIFSYYENSMRTLFEGIPGDIVYCGSLIGKYRST